MSRPHISVENALHEYYKLKDLYDEKFDIKKSSVLSDVTLSIQQKRTDIAKFKRARKCIVCKQTGGTIFTDVDRTLKAVCGIRAQPCNLNITISVGHFELFPITLNDLSSQIKDEKTNIINNKNQNIFGYITAAQTVTLFEKLKVQVSDTTALYMSYLEEYVDIIDNKQKNNDLKRDQEFFYSFLAEIHNAIGLFHSSDNTQYMRDAVDIYVNKLLPLLDKIMKLKYNENKVWYNENDNTYHLIQNKYTFKDIEFNTGQEKVVSFVTK